MIGSLDRPSNQPTYLCLMFIAGPAILFLFPLLFGSDSYQHWENDRFLYELTNRYLFLQASSKSIFGPLWRDDILCGNIWALSLLTTPLAIDLQLGRLLSLSPFGIDMVGSLALYYISAGGMYLYIRHGLHGSVESSAVAGTLFACSTNWINFWVGVVDIPMAVAWLPLMLVMVHRLHGNIADRLHRSIYACGLAILLFGCLVNSSISSSAYMPVLIVLYAVAVFGLSGTTTWVVIGVMLGLVLYSPYLWEILEAALVSTRYQGSYEYRGLKWWDQMLLSIRMALVSHNIYGLSLPVKLGLLVSCITGRARLKESLRTNPILKFAIGIIIIGSVALVFSEEIAAIKNRIPILGGYNLKRFWFFSSFGVIVLFAWVLDRLGNLSVNERLLKLGYAGLAILFLGQIGYVANKMNHIPSSVGFQTYVLWNCYVAYSVITILLLGVFYVHFLSKRSLTHLLIILMILQAALDTSVHAYQRNFSLAHLGKKPQSYKERYSIPENISSIKNRISSNGRAVILGQWAKEGSAEWYKNLRDHTLLSLAKIKTFTGYNALYPKWYKEFLQTATMGYSGRDTTVVLLKDDSIKTDILPLLNVEVILDKGNREIPRYSRISQTADEIVYSLQDKNYVGPAFVSRNYRCFKNDADALSHIRGSTLDELREEAVLVRTDSFTSELCGANLMGSLGTLNGTDKIFVSHGTDKVTIETDTRGGILTLSDTFYPGWIVLVNGEEKPLLRTYTSLRGVRLSSGHQIVEFIYRPRVYLTLRKASVALLLLLIGLLVYSLLAQARNIAWFNFRS